MSVYLPITHVEYRVTYPDDSTSEISMAAAANVDEYDLLDFFWDECDPRQIDQIQNVDVLESYQSFQMASSRYLEDCDMTTETVYTFIDGERRYQDKKWGGLDHDQCHTPLEWTSYMINYLGKYSHYDSTPASRREALIKIAALAVAALETS